MHIWYYCIFCRKNYIIISLILMLKFIFNDAIACYYGDFMLMLNLDAIDGHCGDFIRTCGVGIFIWCRNQGLYDDFLFDFCFNFSGIIHLIMAKSVTLVILYAFIIWWMSLLSSCCLYRLDIRHSSWLVKAHTGQNNF